LLLIGDVLLEFNTFREVQLANFNGSIKIDDGVGVLDVQETVNEEVSALPQETLSDLFEGASFLILGFHKGKIFPSSDLLLSLNSVTLIVILLKGSGVGQDSLFIEVATLLASLSDSVLSLVVAGREESIIDGEGFALDISGKLGDGIITLLLDQELVEFLGDITGNTEHLKNDIEGLVDLSFEASVAVVNDGIVGVTIPGILELLVKLLGLFSIFISGLVVFEGIELLSTISGSDQMDDTVVSLIPELNGIPALLIKDSLP